MRSLAPVLLLLGLILAPLRAFAATLALLTPTNAVAAQTTAPLEFVGGAPLHASIQCNFTYGSGGTSADAWVQTSLDGGATWIDVANCHFTTSSARFAYNLSALTAVATEYTPTDATLTANTSKDGLIGQAMRVKYTTVGTYAGTTLTVSVDVQSLQK
jgi:fermentation-respiration switch protein FrsA (DUF1100 family)